MVKAQSKKNSNSEPQKRSSEYKWDIKKLKRLARRIKETENMIENQHRIEKHGVIGNYRK